MYDPDKNHPEIPYIKNPELGLVIAVSNPNNYPGYLNLSDGNDLYDKGKYERAIEKYSLNIVGELYTLIEHKWDSYIGIAKSYLKLGDISSTINFLHRAILYYQSIDRELEREIIEFDLFREICDFIKNEFGDELNTIKNSLDLYEFTGMLLEDKSGYDLASKIVEYIVEKL